MAKHLFTIGPVIAILQILFQLAHFAYIVYKVSRIPNVSIWYQYEAIYSSYMNSGAPLTVWNFSTHARLMLCEHYGYEYAPLSTRIKKRFFGFLGILLWISVLPGYLTHALPMAFVYIWLGIPTFFSVIWKLIYDEFHKRADSDEADFSEFNDNWGRLFGHYFALTFSQLVVAFFTQTFWNYGVLWYAYDYTYIGVPQTEYNLRNTKCYFENLIADKVAVTNAASALFSFLTYWL